MSVKPLLSGHLQDLSKWIEVCKNCTMFVIMINIQPLFLYYSWLIIAILLQWCSRKALIPKWHKEWMVLFGASLAISKNFQGCGFTHTSATTENEANGRFALKKNVKFVFIWQSNLFYRNERTSNRHLTGDCNLNCETNWQAVDWT